VGTDVSEEHSASIFRDELRMQLGYLFRFQDDHRSMGMRKESDLG
jgi:hypothetical protein